MQIKREVLAAVIACGLLGAAAQAAAQPITLAVDATDAPRNLLHAHLHIPAAPGPLALFYPKWIPGEHAPTGPVGDVVDLKCSADGRPLEWRRDPEEMFTFNLIVPTNATAVDVAFDLILPASGGSSSPHLLDLNWNQVLLYPKTDAPLKKPFSASLQLPAGWHSGTALPLAVTTRNPTGKIEFLPAPLETLVDSPVIAGEYFRSLDLAPGEKIPYHLDIVAENAEALEVTPADVGHFQQLVREAQALFGAQHFRDYHFLLTVSDRVAHFGLEHHESSDNRAGEDFLTDADARTLNADLLPHELVHSWNGKYRRPAGLATPDYQQPMRDDLLWVYEGLTDYLGKVLAARSGLLTNTDFYGIIAMNAAMLDHRSGRDWRSLADTATSAPLLYHSSPEGANRRRSTDFYSEGDLIWLEADTRIRQQTHGEKSLDDFCRLFYGGKDSPPAVVPYSLDDVLQALNAVAPGDWKQFFDERVYSINPRAPLGGIENGGWKLTYTNEVPPFLKLRESQHKYTSLNYSLGFSLNSDGGIGDVLAGSPADQAGIIQGMKLVAVDGRAWSAKIIRAAVKTAATNSAPINLLVESDDFYRTMPVTYHGGEKYPVLERLPARPDLLAEIIRPRTAEPAADSTGKK